MPCIDFFSLNGIKKLLQYSGKYSSYLLSSFIKNLHFTLACRNSPINPIGVLFLCAWKNLIINTLDYSLMMLETRCIQSSPYFASILLLKLPDITYQDFHHIVFLLLDIHARGNWISLPWVIH